MSKLPAFQFYPGDWRKDAGVQALSFHDRGVWFEILCFMHESEQRGKLLLNGKSIPQDSLSRLLGLDNQILTTTLTSLLENGVASKCEATGALMSRRMVRDEEIRQVRKECGKLGGNPNLVNQNSTSLLNQKTTPSVRKMKTEDEVETEKEEFEKARRIYPGKKRSLDVEWNNFQKKHPTYKQVLPLLIPAVERYRSHLAANKTEPRFVKHFQTWINGAEWTAEFSEQKTTPKAYNPLNP